MQLIIAGSRTFTDYQLLCQTLALERSRRHCQVVDPTACPMRYSLR